MCVVYLCGQSLCVVCLCSVLLSVWSVSVYVCALCGLSVCIQIKMSLQLYQVDQKNYLLDFKSLDIADHPDAARVKRMTKASMTGSGDEPSGDSQSLCICLSVYLSVCVVSLSVWIIWQVVVVTLLKL